MLELTYAKVKERALADARGETDETAACLYQAIAVIAKYAHDYDHLSHEEVFDYISTGARPWSKEVEEDETPNTDSILNPYSIPCIDMFGTSVETVWRE